MSIKNFILRWLGYSSNEARMKNLEDFCVLALQKKPSLIQHIESPTEEMCLTTVKKNGMLIKHIENPSDVVKLEAVKSDGDAIQYIENPTEEMCLEAVKNDYSGCVIDYIKNPTEKVKLFIEELSKPFSEEEYANSLTESEQIEYVLNSKSRFKCIKNPSERLCLAVAKEYGSIIDWIKNPSEAVQIAAVKNNGFAIKYIKNPSEAVQLAAVVRNYFAIEHIENPSEKIQLYVVAKSLETIKYIKNPTDAVIKLAAEKQLIKEQGIVAFLKSDPKFKKRSVDVIQQYFTREEVKQAIRENLIIVESNFISLCEDKSVEVISQESE